MHVRKQEKEMRKYKKLELDNCYVYVEKNAHYNMNMMYESLKTMILLMGWKMKSNYFHNSVGITIYKENDNSVEYVLKFWTKNVGIFDKLEIYKRNLNSYVFDTVFSHKKYSVVVRKLVELL